MDIRHLTQIRAIARGTELRRTVVEPRMSAHLAQVCLFKHDGSALRRFCEVVSGGLEMDNGALVSFHMGSATVARHPPLGEFHEGDVLVTLQVTTPSEVDRMYERLKLAQVPLDDAPETTEWGWRLFYFRAADHVVFEVGAPVGASVGA